MTPQKIIEAVDACERIILAHISNRPDLVPEYVKTDLNASDPMSEQEALSHALAICEPTRQIARACSYKNCDKFRKAGSWLGCIQWTIRIFGLGSAHDLRRMNMPSNTEFSEQD